METMKALQSIFICFAATISVVLIVSPFPLTEASTNRFSVELIHRDHCPKSPFYDPSLSYSQRVENDLKRSASWANHFLCIDSPQLPWSKVIADDGAYLMELAIGTPPVPYFVVPDTGSDFMWIQCKPCILCYKQTAPIFNRATSSTYKAISSNSRLCKHSGGQGTTSGSSRLPCTYAIKYGDGSYSYGYQATETISFDSTTRNKVLIPNTIFGCGHKNHGSFYAAEAGLAGLGNGEVSLISQMDSIARGKFSYCLLPHKDGALSKLNFGDNAVVSGNGTVSTGIMIIPNQPYYLMALDTISVGKRIIKSPEKSANSSDSKSLEQINVCIDSGTTLTYLQKDLYGKIRDELKRLIKSRPFIVGEMELCYCPEKDIYFPDITMHFKGADVKLKPVNTLYKVNDTTICLAFALGNGFMTLYGNVVQINFLVGYDLNKSLLYFKPTDCTKA